MLRHVVQMTIPLFYSGFYHCVDFGLQRISALRQLNDIRLQFFILVFVSDFKGNSGHFVHFARAGCSTITTVQCAMFRAVILNKFGGVQPTIMKSVFLVFFLCYISYQILIQKSICALVAFNLRWYSVQETHSHSLHTAQNFTAVTLFPASAHGLQNGAPALSGSLPPISICVVLQVKLTLL